MTISGLSPALEQNVRALLTMARQPADSPAAQIQLAQDRAPEEIRKALEPFGYYRPQVEAALRRVNGQWRAVYRVDPGPPLRVTEVDVRIFGEAAALPEMQALVREFPLKAGAVLDQPRYEKGKGALQDLAAELGFFDARLTRHEIRVDLSAYRAAIHLWLDSGPRYRFGPVKFNETPLQPSLLKRFVQFRPGDPYRASAVLALQRNLLNSGYFQTADVAPKPRQARARETPIQVELGMQPRHRFNIGVGYGTDTGPRTSLAYWNRYVNSYGHSFQASARLSLIWNDLDLLYAIPLANPVRDQLAFTAKSGLENTVAGESRVVRAGVRHSTARWGLRELLALDYHRETFRLNGATQTTQLLIPSLNYTWLRSDNQIYPQHGFRLDGYLGGAWRGLATDVSFLKAQLNAKGVYGLDDENRLIARGQLGWLVTDDFDRLPLTQRFYTGGDQTVRGYRFNEISPKDARGERIGGRYLTVASLEYEHLLFGTWGVAVFTDVGRVANGAGDPFRVGVGLGLRWRSPIGPVRLDLGVPLGKALDPVQVHVVLGPDL
ncbi:autotransporter assembly complex protein TamA [Candidatus Methylocalor cossyra]|uniref:autotransporter assembly complex protein TamA n=1 Tax=Candidatus Methylocalor cossyra TaxID=3108543 RepID=UPI0032B21070